MRKMRLLLINGLLATALFAAGAFGVDVPSGVRVDFGAVMARMRRLRAALSPTDSAERYRRLGVDVFLGNGEFAGPDAVVVEGRTLRFHKAVIATGARASRPAMDSSRSRSRLGSLRRAGGSVRASVWAQVVSSQDSATMAHQILFWARSCSGRL